MVEQRKPRPTILDPHQDDWLDQQLRLAEHLGCKPEDVKIDLVALVTAAQEARNYFEPLMDADQPSGSQPIPNDEMRLYLELDQALPHDTVDRADIGHKE